MDNKTLKNEYEQGKNRLAVRTNSFEGRMRLCAGCGADAHQKDTVPAYGIYICSERSCLRYAR